MKFLISVLLVTMPLTSIAKKVNGFKIDENENNKKYKIKLVSGKKDDIRFYQGIREKVLDQPIEFVKNSIINFEEKCNNDYKDRRELLSKKKECKYHNGNLVESKIYRDLKSYTPAENEIERFLVARRIYNRQSFSHIDLFQVFKTKNEQGQTVISIKGQMLKDKQVKKFMKPVVEKDSVFNKAYYEFKLTEMAENKTTLKYTYSSETDHWLLNKSVSVSKVFDGMAKSIDLLFYSIQKEAVALGKKVIKSSTVAVQKSKKQ